MSRTVAAHASVRHSVCTLEAHVILAVYCQNCLISASCFGQPESTSALTQFDSLVISFPVRALASMAARTCKHTRHSFPCSPPVACIPHTTFKQLVAWPCAPRRQAMPQAMTQAFANQFQPQSAPQVSIAVLTIRKPFCLYHCTPMQPPREAPQHTCRCLSSVHKHGTEPACAKPQSTIMIACTTWICPELLCLPAYGCCARTPRTDASKQGPVARFLAAPPACASSKHRRRASELPQLGHILLQQRIQPAALRRHRLPQVCLHATLEVACATSTFLRKVLGSCHTWKLR